MNRDKNRLALCGSVLQDRYGDSKVPENYFSYLTRLRVFSENVHLRITFGLSKMLQYEIIFPYYASEFYDTCLSQSHFQAIRSNLMTYFFLSKYHVYFKLEVYKKLS